VGKLSRNELRSYKISKMKLLIVSVGHKMPDWITAGFNEYVKRMPREAQIVLLEIKPEPRSSGKTTMQIMEAEAQRILAALPQHCLRIALEATAGTVRTHLAACFCAGAAGRTVVSGAQLDAQSPLPSRIKTFIRRLPRRGFCALGYADSPGLVMAQFFSALIRVIW